MSANRIDWVPSGGVKVTAFLVDHGPVKPAFGFRLDYHGHSVVVSGDTRPSDNLIKFSQGVDLLIHEVGGWKQDPLLVGPPDEPYPDPGVRQTRRERIAINDHHTDGTEAGQVFQRVKPKLAVFCNFRGGSCGNRKQDGVRWMLDHPGLRSQPATAGADRILGKPCW